MSNRSFILKNDNDQLKFDTLAVHAGHEPDPTTGAVMMPIYATSTYVQQAPGVHQGYEYSRSQNPTRAAYESCVATLAGGTAGFAFGSGMAAIATMLELLDSGDHVISMDDVYGGSYRLFDKVRTRSSGLQFDFIDLTNPELFKAAIRPETKMVWIETPTNPTLKVVDIELIAGIAKQHDLLVVVDNTFATPWIQQPLKLGADLVIHSATKYLNGHCDVVSGVVVVGDNPDLAERMAFLQNSIGAVIGPFDSYLVLRGLKTLALRMQRHCDNAMALAQWLSEHDAVSKVIYPGLPSHPQHDVAKKQMHAFGGMIAMEVKGGLEAAKRVIERCQLFLLAESLGGVESLIQLPAIMTHASVPAEQREQLGITDGLLRLSVGIESVVDLKADLARALS